MNAMNELPLIPASTKQSGEYAHAGEGSSDWHYTYSIVAAGTRSERRVGRLGVTGLDLSKAKPGDRVPTPWGIMQLAKASYEQGWLLEGTYGRPIDATQGQLIAVPQELLARGGTWTADVEKWNYTLLANAMGTRSEQRIGRLRFGHIPVMGNKEGDFVDTPWGTLRWMGPVNPETKTDYEQGFLLRGTSDRSLENLTGAQIVPTEATTCRLESLYLEGVKLKEELPAAHFIALETSDRPDRSGTLTGTLMLDPNICQLNAFGDRQGCTKMAVRAIDVRVTRQRLADPSGLGRSFFRVEGDGVPEATALIVQGRLERAFLKVQQHLVPLFLAPHGNT